MANCPVTSVPARVTRTCEGCTPPGRSTATSASPPEITSARFESTSSRRPLAPDAIGANQAAVAARHRTAAAALISPRMTGRQASGTSRTVRRFSARARSAPQELSEPVAELEHVTPQPVGVVVSPPLEVLEVGAVVGHRVADHLVHPDPEPLLEPADQAQGGVDLPVPMKDLPVGPVRASAALLHHLHADRSVVQPDRVAAADPRPDETVDAPVLSDHEVRADAGPLPHVGRVGGERVPRGPVGGA